MKWIAAVVFVVLLMSCQRVGATEVASCYHEDSKTASGERFRANGNTAARRLGSVGSGFGSIVTVCLGTHCVKDVRINDRGPFIAGRTIDLALGVCKKLPGMVARGVAPVTLHWQHAWTDNGRKRKRKRTTRMVSL